MRVGLVCPYSWDVPGGVQAHVADLAEALVSRGHEVSVFAPADDDRALPAYVVPAGRAVPVPYNGSVARLTLGPLSNARVRRWLRDGAFDVVHVHEPSVPSVSLLACWAADGPLVATFHTSTNRSRAYHTFWAGLETAFEKIDARVAVSEAARRTLVEHAGGDAVVIPNGVHVRRFAEAEPLPAGPRGAPRDGEAVLGFLGRLDEPRKGLQVLLEAFTRLAPGRPGLRLLLAGPGDAEEVLAQVPAALTDRVVPLGRVSEADKPRFYRSCSVFVAPAIGGESFGIVLLEALSAGARVVASDLDSFRAVLDDGRAGRLFAVGDAAALAEALDEVLDDEAGRAAAVEAGRAVAHRFDWSHVASQLVAVYETVISSHRAVAGGARR